MTAKRGSTDDGASTPVTKTQHTWLREPPSSSHDIYFQPATPPTPTPPPRALRRTKREPQYLGTIPLAEISNTNQATSNGLPIVSQNLTHGARPDLRAPISNSRQSVLPTSQNDNVECRPRSNNFVHNSHPDRLSAPNPFFIHEETEQKEGPLYGTAMSNETSQTFDAPSVYNTQHHPHPDQSTVPHNNLSTPFQDTTFSFPLPSIMLPAMNPDRPLQSNDEVHLLDENNSDPTGNAIHTIKYINPTNGLHMLSRTTGSTTNAATNETTIAHSSMLKRAPLAQGSIVGVFQRVMHVLARSEADINVEQVDWGAVVGRCVVDGERRYDVLSRGDGGAGVVWWGLRDGEVGQLDLGLDLDVDFGFGG